MANGPFPPLNEPASVGLRTGPLVVVKVGGSLLGWRRFPERLADHLIDSRPARLVLIVGAGRAGDFVRELDSLHAIGDTRAHALALRALDLTAHVVAALVPGLVVVERPDELPWVWKTGGVPLLSPRWFLESVDRTSDDPLAESWDVTTDSIAARVAVFLGADELRLLKSRGLGELRGRSAAARAGLVDPAFPAASALCPRVTVVNLRADPPTRESFEGFLTCGAADAVPSDDRAPRADHRGPRTVRGQTVSARSEDILTD